jgi:excisionase family DNA binding protein
LRPPPEDGLIGCRCATGPSTSADARTPPPAQTPGRRLTHAAAREIERARSDGAALRLLVSPEEAARALSVGRTTMYRLLAEGAVASVRVGSRRRVPLAALETYVAGLASQASHEV